MGLDITAYRKLKVIENPELDEEGEVINWNTEWRPGESMEWSERHFPGRGEGIDTQKVYSWEEAFDFRAGSYSGYNWWRLKLEQFAAGKDFEELINFADNEGVIGPIVSKKLAVDFKNNETAAQEYADTFGDGEWWLSQYQLWKKAFELAADSGAVEFR